MNPAPLTFQVTEARNFGDGGAFLGFTANGPTGPFEGTVWEKNLHHHFTPGAKLTVMVYPNEDKKSGAAFCTFKNKTKLEITKTAQITVEGAQAAPQPQTAPTTFQQAATPPVANYGAAGAKSGEEILGRAASLAATYRDELVRHGFDPAIAATVAPQVAATMVSQWWFGEGKWA